MRFLPESLEDSFDGGLNHLTFTELFLVVQKVTPSVESGLGKKKTFGITFH